MITGIAHACFIVRDLQTSEDFYCGKLGFKKAFEFRNDAGQRTGMYMHVGGRTFIEVFEGKHEASTQPQSYRHICLEVDDFDATVAELRRRGADVTRVSLGVDNSYQGWLVDPDGNQIELHGYTPKSWQAPHLK